MPRWLLPIQIKMQEFYSPKDNMSQGERKALKELSRDKNIVIKKADKGTTTVIMNRTDKLNEGQVQIDDIHNYRPLDNPMVGTTAKKVHRLIQSLLQEGHIDDMTAKWLSLTPDPPRIPVFYTLTKIHKLTPVGRPIMSGCDGRTERISAFVDHEACFYWLIHTITVVATSLSQRYNRLS